MTDKERKRRRRESYRKYNSKPSRRKYMRVYCREWHRRNPRTLEEIYATRLLSKSRGKYGLTWAQWKRQLKRRCMVCGARPVGIDHDHRTGKRRGVLCRKCNFAIGLFKDSPKLLRRALRYLS